MVTQIRERSKRALDCFAKHVMSPDPTKPRFECSRCQKHFSRSEHLTRHSAIHDGTQNHTCDDCGKGFPRKDALTRHMLTHRGGPNLLEKKARACRPCAKAKVRCSGQKPCVRCKSKDVSDECNFPQPRPHQKISSAVVFPSPESDSQLPDDTDLSDAQDSTNVQSFAPDVDPLAGHLSHASLSPEVVMSGYSPEVHGSMSSQGNQKFDQPQWNQPDTPSMNWLSAGNSTTVDTYDDSNAQTSYRSPSISYQQNSLPLPHSHHDTSAIAEDSAVQHTGNQGDFYASGNLPRIKRQKIIARRPSELCKREFGWRLFWLPPISRGAPTGEYFADYEYEALRSAYLTLCVNCAPVLTPFATSDFPPVEAFDFLMHLFFKHVHPSVPFVHRPTYNPDREGRWVLLLSMVSAACWFLEDEITDDFAESMLEFLKRVVLLFDDSNGWQKSSVTNCRQAQIRLLFMLSASASRHGSVKLWSDRCMGELCHIVNRSICQSYPRAQYTHAGMPTSAEWIDWSECEQTRRTAFLVWQVGLLRSMEDPDGRPPVSLNSIAQLRLPCTDDVFEACDAETWQALYCRYPTITFQEALLNLYVDKRLIPSLSGLSHLLLTYGVIQRTCEVQDLVKQPLSLIEPSIEKRSSEELVMQSTWAPAVPLYLKWRSSACDCLDILHSQMGYDRGRDGETEQTRILQMHLARVLLLAPLHELLSLARLARYSFPSSVGTEHPEDLELRHNIQRWATNDQYTARLAAVHAGIVLWQVRRYSTNAYYEPFALLAAALTLWALSTFSVKKDRAMRSPPEAQSEECSIILIDRPTDDELVQQFVRQGQDMLVHMTGVDDLWAPSAPYKVLNQVRNLLATLGAFAGETERSLGLIDALMMTGQRDT